MSEIISIIKSLPIRKITDVYLTGSDKDYYKLYLTDNSQTAVWIVLKKVWKKIFLFLLLKI